MTNPLQRGIDPYADADTTRALLMPSVTIPFLDAAVAAGTSQFAAAPIAGRLRRVFATMTVQVDADADVTIEIATNVLVTINALNADPAGTVYRVEVADGTGVLDNSVSVGTAVEVDSDAGTTAVGAFNITLVFDPGDA